MNAQLIESDEEHHWVLLEHRVTQLAVDLRSLRLQTWSMDGSAEIRIATAFVLRLTSGSARELDPARPETLAPALGLVGLPVRSLTMARSGQLLVQVGDDATIEVGPDARVDAWEVQGGGVLEGMLYRCPPRGGVPWQ